jgi:hypothetical protein
MKGLLCKPAGVLHCLSSRWARSHGTLRIQVSNLVHRKYQGSAHVASETGAHNSLRSEYIPDKEAGCIVSADATRVPVLR